MSHGDTNNVEISHQLPHISVSPVDGLLTTADLAKLLQVTESHVDSLRKKGLIDSIDLSAGDSKRGRWRYTRKAYEDFLAARKKASQTSKPRRRNAGAGLPPVKDYMG